jgi:O-methyltransferase
MGQPPSLIGPPALAELMRLAEAAPNGRMVEVGVYQGGSAWCLATIAEQRGVELHLFDTFRGIPFTGILDYHRAGDFADTSVEAVRQALPTAIFHVGIFPETLPNDLDQIGFAHIDCDQYRSVRDCIECLGPRMLPKGIMVFDDYSHLDGATAAVKELLGEPPRSAGGRYHWVF